MKIKSDTVIEIALYNNTRDKIKSPCAAFKKNLTFIESFGPSITLARSTFIRKTNEFATKILNAVNQIALVTEAIKANEGEIKALETRTKVHSVNLFYGRSRLSIYSVFGLGLC
jgi:hypothetical protein